MVFKVLEPVIEGEFSVTKWDNNTILELCGSGGGLDFWQRF